MQHDYQIVIMADPRFPGGSSRAASAEARALSNAGISAAFCPMLSSVLKQSHDFHPAFEEFVADGTLTVIDPRVRATARLVIAHHPAIFENLPHDPFGLCPETLILVLHHPLYDGLGRRQYDLRRVVDNAAELMGCRVILAPVSAVIRRQLINHGADAEMLPEDWRNLIDFADWPLGPRRQQDGSGIVIGRHSRPQLSKFPDTREEAVQVYPANSGFQVRMLGCPDDLQEVYAPVPRNWDLLAFGSQDVRQFLRGLDYYVYFHGREWVEAFGYAVLEAIATGIPAILPPQFEPAFGAAALYAEPGGVMAVIKGLESDPEARRKHVQKARFLAEQVFSIDGFLPRLDRVIPGWKPGARPAGRSSTRVIMMTSNGVGLGHLTRMLAVAKHFPDSTRTAFFTLSQGFRLAVEAGYPTQFVPFHRSSGAEPEAWNRALAEELGDFLDLMRPDIFVFDGNVPYPGAMLALDHRRWIKRVWMRRALWNGEGSVTKNPGAQFDLVLEPGELSARFDTGVTTGWRARQLQPVLQIDPAERLSRKDALAEMGLDHGRLNVGLMLGAATNFDLSAIRSVLLDRLAARNDCTVTEFEAPIAVRGGGEAEIHRKISCYPVARISAAFDFMIASAGYNSFHEALLHHVPTIFVPNEAEEMDRQILRARYARSIGCSEVLRASDRIGVAAIVDRMCDPGVRAQMIDRMSRFTVRGGAKEAAEIIQRFGTMTRVSSGF